MPLAGVAGIDLAAGIADTLAWYRQTCAVTSRLNPLASRTCSAIAAIWC